MNGNDWIYNVLLLTAREHGRHGVEEVVKQLMPNVIEDCWMQAVVDIDWKVDYNGSYAIIRDVCKELAESRK